MRTTFQRLFVAGTVVTMSVVADAQPRSMKLWAGTWMRNVAKSTFEPGPRPKTAQIVRHEIVNGLLYVTTDGFDSEGQSVHTVAIVTFDETERAVVGAAQPTTRVYRWIDERTFEGVTRISGQVTTTTRYALAADGKTHTLTTKGKNTQGQAVNDVVVYERR